MKMNEREDDDEEKTRLNTQENKSEENNPSWRTWSERLKRIPMLGMILALISACLFGVCNIIVKKVGRYKKKGKKRPSPPPNQFFPGYIFMREDAQKKFAYNFFLWFRGHENKKK